LHNENRKKKKLGINVARAHAKITAMLHVGLKTPKHAHILLFILEIDYFFNSGFIYFPLKNINALA
jgi:hypothetical protein